ncbi:hypothetical protein ACLOJK_038197 [Asimina triloba]
MIPISLFQSSILSLRSASTHDLLVFIFVTGRRRHHLRRNTAAGLKAAPTSLSQAAIIFVAGRLSVSLAASSVCLNPPRSACLPRRFPIYLTLPACLIVFRSTSPSRRHLPPLFLCSASPVAARLAVSHQARKLADALPHRSPPGSTSALLAAGYRLPCCWLAPAG